MKNRIVLYLIFFHLLIINEVLGQTKIESKTYPYCLVVKLLMYKGNSIYHGTGVIIDSQNIITNAHNVYEKDSIKIISGYSDKMDDDIGNVTVHCEYDKSIFYDNRFEDSKQYKLYDFAVIKYNEEELFNKILRITKNRKFELVQLQINTNSRIHISGYPYFRFFEIGKPKKAKIQYYNFTDKYTFQKGGLINYRLSTRGGSSGSPLWIEKDGKLYIIGIHKSGKRLKNQGIYFDKEKYELLKNWLNNLGV